MKRALYADTVAPHKRYFMRALEKKGWEIDPYGNFNFYLLHRVEEVEEFDFPFDGIISTVVESDDGDPATLSYRKQLHAGLDYLQEIRQTKKIPVVLLTELGPEHFHLIQRPGEQWENIVSKHDYSRAPKMIIKTLKWALKNNQHWDYLAFPDKFRYLSDMVRIPATKRSKAFMISRYPASCALYSLSDFRAAVTNFWLRERALWSSFAVSGISWYDADAVCGMHPDCRLPSREEFFRAWETGAIAAYNPNACLHEAGTPWVHEWLSDRTASTEHRLQIGWKPHPGGFRLVMPVYE